MKTLSITLTALLALTVSGCGNDTFLLNSGAFGVNGNGQGDGESEGEEHPDCDVDEAAQEAAINDLADNICADCWPAEGTAHEIWAKVLPGEYSGGALEMSVLFASPNGLVGDETFVKINGISLEIPLEAFKLSEDGTIGRVVLLLEGGLPVGEYHVGAAISEGTASFSESEPTPESETSADAGTSWMVACEETPDEGDEHPDDGEEHPDDEGETAPPAGDDHEA